jgi:hypothetical protein
MQFTSLPLGAFLGLFSSILSVTYIAISRKIKLFAWAMHVSSTLVQH